MRIKKLWRIICFWWERKIEQPLWKTVWRVLNKNNQKERKRKTIQNMEFTQRLYIAEGFYESIDDVSRQAVVLDRSRSFRPDLIFKPEMWPQILVSPDLTLRLQQAIIQMNGVFVFSFRCTMEATSFRQHSPWVRKRNW